MSKKRGNLNLKKLVVFLLILLIVFLFDQYIAPVSLPSSTPEPTQLSASNDFGDIQVYFTTPNSSSEVGLETNLISLIDQANESIDVAVFELDLENVADALLTAHERGVLVRIVHDNEYTQEDGLISLLQSAGIEAVGDERSALMHNKFFVIDGRIVWTGSWNATSNGSLRNNNNVVVFFSQAMALNYEAEFNEMFSGEFGPTSPQNTTNPIIELSGVEIRTFFSPEDPIFPSLNSLVASADQSVHFMAFSFTDDSLGDAMLAAAGNGAEVQGLFETRGANTEYSECNRLLASGLDVRLDANPATMHHKVLIIDGEIVITGSFNFSASAAESNDENLVIIYDPSIASLFELEFDRLMSEAYQPQGTCSR
jgi:phosphatidylserine/phosphatidylglycerophosphate/cardiolipin synthase-like enzyme